MAASNLKDWRSGHIRRQNPETMHDHKKDGDNVESKDFDGDNPGGLFSAVYLVIESTGCP